MAFKNRERLFQLLGGLPLPFLVIAVGLWLNSRTAHYALSRALLKGGLAAAMLVTPVLFYRAIRILIPAATLGARCGAAVLAAVASVIWLGTAWVYLTVGYAALGGNF